MVNANATLLENLDVMFFIYVMPKLVHKKSSYAHAYSNTDDPALLITVLVQ